MYSLWFLFCLAVGIADATTPCSGDLKHVIVTYRAPEQMPCDYFPELKIAGKNESESELTENGKEAVYDFGKEMSAKYGPQLKIKDWDKESRNFGIFLKITKDAALVFESGLKGDESGKTKQWTDEDRQKTTYTKIEEMFSKFKKLDQCPGLVQALGSVRELIQKLVQENYKDLQVIANKYGFNLSTPHFFPTAYETLMQQKAAGETLDEDVEKALPGLKKFSEGFLYTTFSTVDLKKLAGGRLLHRIFEILETRKKGESLPNDSGDGNISASFLAAPASGVAVQLAVFNPSGTQYGGKEISAENGFFPEHGAAHVVELYQDGYKWKIRVLYRQKAGEDFKAALFPGCNVTTCDFETVKKAVENIAQTEEKQDQQCKEIKEK